MLFQLGAINAEVKHTSALEVQYFSAKALQQRYILFFWMKYFGIPIPYTLRQI